MYFLSTQILFQFEFHKIALAIMFTKVPFDFERFAKLSSIKNVITYKNRSRHCFYQSAFDCKSEGIYKITVGLIWF